MKMRITTIASTAVLTLMLGLSSGAYAQTMIGNQNLTEADVQRVQTYCDDLKTASEQAVGAEASDENATEADESDESEAGQIGTLDMDAITLENCIEAGFVER
jgi:hypothetical protein